MASRSAANRPVITMRSTEGTGSTYTTTKSRRNTPDRLELVKFDPVLRRRVTFRETR
ncbi:50S ribosomal protein L33 [Bifidobacterium mongoliense]|uniref:Large ribosomal subunit protein bL33 n=2 Tax=Bifidobacterium mongoliense TaxID=518643 RepID=A0A087C4R5_9BIFI|nr:50S ribosomal protein L33 [Bifidobacterium mongoliense]KFI78265.1 50S ribosomal protein L33 [Bifidobacterium mongoliense DSM 21395]MDN5633786.1 50S ribosomal protein L33 [Bifidobacterium mongoliense]MDN5979899.1 50S ribosomal protein L33 [Bifidobacterium mongoliense]MDN6017155.1 50S ribosomal protein L33 [Bifidobacterium mongoliense]MDN6024845.1 50S ribosomal protein L33 [Bifidobacterium mongoliense]